MAAAREQAHQRACPTHDQPMAVVLWRPAASGVRQSGEATLCAKDQDAHFRKIETVFA
jgi:hypothetical protein